MLRENGLLTVREEFERELLDAGASKAFAVAAAQILQHLKGKEGDVSFV